MIETLETNIDRINILLTKCYLFQTSLILSTCCSSKDSVIADLLGHYLRNAAVHQNYRYLYLR